MDMRQRIEVLLKDTRLQWLMMEPEFAGAPVKLDKALKGHENGGISLEQEQYIEQVERHIKLIKPHSKKMTVNGQEVEVFFATDTDAPLAEAQ